MHPLCSHLSMQPKRNRYTNYRSLMDEKKRSKVKDLSSDEALKKHLAVELKKQIDVARSKYDKKHQKRDGKRAGEKKKK